MTNGVLADGRAEFARAIGRLAAFLAVDPLTLIALVKLLTKLGVSTVERDPDDRHSRRLRAMQEDLEVWRAEHAALEQDVGEDFSGSLRQEFSGNLPVFLECG